MNNYTKYMEYLGGLKEMRKKARASYELANVELMLRGKEPEPFVFRPTRPPPFRTFMRKHEMMEVIAKAFDERLRWDEFVARKS